jgi:hypothetical protein
LKLQHQLATHALSLAFAVCLGNLGQRKYPADQYVHLARGNELGDFS